MFDERFSVPLDSVNLEENSLRFSTFAVDSDERNISAGVAELKLSDLDLPFRPFNAWLYLQDINKVHHTWSGCVILPLNWKKWKSINVLLYVEMERMSYFVQGVQFIEVLQKADSLFLLRLWMLSARSCCLSVICRLQSVSPWSSPKPRTWSGLMERPQQVWSWATFVSTDFWLLATTTTSW